MKTFNRCMLQGLCIAIFGVLTARFAVSAADVDLWQAANGNAASPTNPVQWTGGWLSVTNAHFIESHSVAFRATLTNIAPGPHTLTIGWLTKTNGQNAYDFLTHYDRLLPHTQFPGHFVPETVDPLSDLAGAFGIPATFAIPSPSSSGSPVPGQPSASFGILPVSERLMSIWNGQITNISYITEDGLTNDPAATSILVEFEAADTKVVIAWGAHIAARADWGYGNTASGPSGSSYQLRLLTLDGQNLDPGGAGRDLVLASAAVQSPPTCQIIGATNVCGATTNSFIAFTDATNASPTYAWAFLTNNSDAYIIGDTNQPTVQVFAGTNGFFALTATVTTAAGFSNSAITVTVLAPAFASALANQTVCPGTDVTFATTPGGTGPFTFIWRKDGNTISDATNSSLTLTNVSAGDAANYCVEVAGACGLVTNCATLAVVASPPISCPTNLTVECLGGVPAPDTNSVATAPAVSVFHIGDAITTNGCEFVITRSYAAVNSCNLTSICSQIITVRDTTPPDIFCASNRVVGCGEAWDFDPPSATDNCAGTNVGIAVINTITNPLCGMTFAATRTWVATDLCGNTNTCSQTVTVVDLTGPVILCASNRVVECSATWAFEPPYVFDNCDGTNIGLAIVSTTTNNHCGSTYTATRTWLATDACGNTNSCSQIVDVVDTTPPAIGCNTNRTVECSVAWDFDTPSVSDACDTNVLLTITGTLTNNHCGATFTATRTWLATDACGNTNSCSQTIDVVDTTPPTIVCGTNRTVECSMAWDFDTPSVSDACDTNVLLTITGTLTNNHCGTTFTATRTWLATDACGNTNSCSQTIDVVDTTPPTIVCGTNRTVECTVPWTFDTPLVSDACDPTNVVLTITGTTITNHCGSTFTTTRTWLATDACGNTNSCSQTVEVVDTTAPVITCASNIEVECVGPAGTPVSFTITATDACDTNILIYSVPPSGTAFTVGTNTVNSFAVDSCGNTNTCAFTVMVIDTTPPTIACPADIIAAESPRDSGSAAVTYPTPAVGDICDGGLAPVTFPVSGFVFPIGTNVVNAFVTDDSGNSNSCTFTIRVIPYRLYVTNGADAGPGTLRQALLDANAAPGENLVLFNLPGAGVRTIALATSLPEITSPIIINGWSQPGFVNKPLVEVKGGNLPALTNGLVINAGASTVRGLTLNGFDTALRLTGNGTNVIQGNFIGTDGTGTNIAANTGDGLYISCDRNLIGGTTNLSDNVIAGNGGSGIHFDGAAATLNVVQGNLIGVGANDVTPAGNGLDGVRLENGATRNSLGVSSAPGLNVMAFNGRNGVTLEATAGTRNAIFANLIHHNGGLGIDLGNDGPTPNDAGDSDSGPNQLQNFPVLTDARYDGGLVIEGTLNSTPNAVYRLDFWLNNTPDPSTNGEGQFYLGSSTVTLNGSGAESFAVGFTVSAVYTQFVSAVATDVSGNSSEFSKALQVRTPPVLEVVPVGTNTTAGGTVTFCASASGTTPIFYQWRLNGQNIPGATNACYTLPQVQSTNGGTYSVVVYNVLGSSLTAPAPLVLSITNAIAAGDNFIDRVTLSGSSGLTAGSNSNATREVGEPVHAGKPGGKSVWYTWKAKETGIMTIGTSGSDFDTLLGVYTGTKVTNLVVVASDEDGGGYFTSGVRFNVIEDQRYHFAIDGYGGDGGDFVFGWEFDDTERLLPVITTQPQSQTVAPGSNVTFTVVAVRQCKDGHVPCNNQYHYHHDHLPALSVQWYFEGNPIPGKTNYSLFITNVDDINVGQYHAAVTATYEMDDHDNYQMWGNHDHDHDHLLLRTVESAVADLQINVTGFTYESVRARDKLTDALLDAPWIIGTVPVIATVQNAPPQYGLTAVSTVVSGFTGTQVFNTAGSTTSPAEDPICGVLGGASEWLTFVTTDGGYLFLNTDGSSYDTVIAVFQQLSSGALQYIACDNNSGPNGRTSSLTIPVQAGKSYALIVDGVNGAAGTLRLNYSLASSQITLKALAPVSGTARLQVAGWAGMKFSIQSSTNLTTWTTVLTTNSASTPYTFTDTNKVNKARFYRAKIEP